MNEKQQQLTFDKGITNVPSDALCSDNTLQESLGMVYDNGEHRVIQKPKSTGTVSGTLVFVHNGRKIVTNNNQVGWMNNGTFTAISSYTGSLSVSDTGNTLVLSHGGGIAYAKWDGTAYESFTDLPDITFTPKLVKRDGSTEIVKYPLNINGSNPYGIQIAYHTINDDGTISFDHSNLNTQEYMLVGDVYQVKAFEDYITGAVEDYLNTLKKDYNVFVYPFWVRYALELYDGSITKLSAPILMFPAVRTGVVMRQINKDGGDPVPNGSINNDWICCSSNQDYLHFKLGCSRINGYDDIVKGVKIYVSREVRTEKTNDDKWDFYNPGYSTSHRMQDCVDGYSDHDVMQYKKTMMDAPPTAPKEVSSFYRSFVYAPQKTDKEIKEELISNSVFYELCDIPYSQLVSDSQEDEYNPGTFVLDNTYHAEDLMIDDALVNIETLPQMPHDDYYSHTVISSGKLFAYNSRINVFDFKRKAFEGFKIFTAESTNSEHVITIVTIQTDSGLLKVKHEFYTSWYLEHYFFYPDSRASKAEIYLYRDSTWKYYKTFDLKEHPYLNGAYAFDTLPYDTGSVWNGPFGEHAYTFYPDNFYLSLTTPSVNPTTIVNNDMEDMYNMIITSEVNNPFVFYAEGYNRVGDGVILGLATQTVALSDGTEFGSQPLIVFTNKGLWSMAVNNEGLYQYIKPLSREVCNSAKSITQTDGAVFFSSEKGLMVVIGSQVKCVSEQLDGKSELPFATFLKTAFIAYDYRDSLLWLFDGATHGTGQNTVTGSRYCYVYSIKSGTFARYDFGTSNNNPVIVTNVVADYPDYLLQIGSDIYSLIERPNINADGTTSGGTFTPNTYSAQLITRPMKLENALALKSLMQVRHIYDFHVTTPPASAPALALHIFASNNLHKWVELNSLRGTPWKYYKFQYDFSNLIATDRFAGTMLITQERRTDKLR